MAMAAPGCSVVQLPSPILSPFPTSCGSPHPWDAPYLCQSRITLGLPCQLQDTKKAKSLTWVFSSPPISCRERLRNLSPSSCQGCNNPPLCDVRDARNPGLEAIRLTLGLLGTSVCLYQSKQSLYPVQESDWPTLLSPEPAGNLMVGSSCPEDFFQSTVVFCFCPG